MGRAGWVVVVAPHGSAVVVAHSYGGIVTAEAATGVGAVRHLLLVSSYLPEIGQGLSDFGDGNPSPFLDIDPDAGTFGVRPELLVDTFLHDCDPDTQAQASDHLSRQSVQVTGQPVGAAAWQQVPTTYLVCAQDRGTPARLQREFARRASNARVGRGRALSGTPRCSDPPRTWARLRIPAMADP
jgi:pimeloyl-ACP methyl ester carboxylesterase